MKNSRGWSSVRSCRFLLPWTLGRMVLCHWECVIEVNRESLRDMASWRVPLMGGKDVNVSLSKFSKEEVEDTSHCSTAVRTLLGRDDRKVDADGEVPPERETKIK